MEGERNKKTYKKKKKKTSITSVNYFSRHGFSMGNNAESRSVKRKKQIMSVVEAGDITQLSTMISSDDKLLVDIKTTSEFLQRACEKGRLDMAAMLLRHEVPVDVLGEKEMSPLHVAVKKGHAAIIALLLSHGANANIRTKSEKRTPLHLAAIMGQENMAFLLLQNEADVDQADIYGSSPLHLACQLGRRGVATMLLKYGAAVNAYDNEGWTGLHLAAEAGQLDVMQLLVRHHADVNQQTRYGRTALHWAVIRERLPAVRQLLEVECNVVIRDAHDKAAVNYCCNASTRRLIEYHSHKAETNGVLTPPGVTIPIGRQSSIVGKMMSSKFTLFTPSLSSASSDSEPDLTSLTSTSSIDANVIRVLQTKADVVNDINGNLPTCNSIENIYDHQPKSDRGQLTAASMLTPEILPVMPEQSKENCITAAAGNHHLNARLCKSLDGVSTLKLLASQTINTQLTAVSTPCLPITSTNQCTDCNQDTTQHFLKMAANAREQIKEMEASIGDLIASTSKALNKGSDVTPIFLTNLHQWGKDVQHKMQLLRQELELKKMMDKSSEHSRPQALPVVVYCHFLSAVGRHIEQSTTGWITFMQKLSTEIDNLGNDDTTVTTSNDASAGGSYEALFKLFKLAHHLKVPPMKYTLDFLERCNMAGVSHRNILMDFVRGVGQTVQVSEDVLSAATVDAVAKGLGSDGHRLGVALGVAGPGLLDLALQDEKSQSGHTYCNYNTAVLFKWQSLCADHHRQENRVSIIGNLIDIGREDLLTALFSLQ